MSALMAGSILSPAQVEILVVLGAVMVRVLVGLCSYSGAQTPPKYGDYEAQRHWMEVTINTPVSQWYSESTANNATYWPLDYPPLSGYQSWVHGQVLRWLEPAAVELYTSQGYESPSSKLIMRMTVLASDLAIFFPAVSAAAVALHGRTPSPARAFTLAAALLNPAHVLIDHGHFQYNCISLGLAAGAVAAIAAGRQLTGSVLFCLALSHKQMCLYYAFAFFGHLLGRSLQQRSVGGKVLAVARLGVVVIATFGATWTPWLGSTQSLLRVVHRIFPVKRGLYEDYVSNFWCASSLVFKWKARLPDGLLLKAALAATLAASAPAVIQQAAAPSARGLLLCMACTGFAFYMFSYQVHEKSVMLPLMPITLLAADHPRLATWLPLVSSFSMFPLLVRDGVATAYAGLCLLYAALMWPWGESVAAAAPPAAAAATAAAGGAQAAAALEAGGAASPRGQGALARAHDWLLQRLTACAGWLFVAGWALALAMHAGKEWLPPPDRYLWLYDRAFITFSFALFALAMLHANLAMWRQPQAKQARRKVE